MKLEGKAKKDFIRYLFTKVNYTILTIKDYGQLSFSEIWSNLPESCKYGLLVDFFDSKGIELLISKWSSGHYSVGYLSKIAEYTLAGARNKFFDRREAREAAIKKAVEIYNNRVNE